jgi:hypothetical protein
MLPTTRDQLLALKQLGLVQYSQTQPSFIPHANKIPLCRETIVCDPIFTLRTDEDIVFMQVIRTGPHYEEYWIRRLNMETTSPLDRRILFKQSTLPGHYKPFPQFTFDANEFFDDWIEFDIRGEKIMGLKATPGLDFLNLRGGPSITPIITLQDIFNFNKYIATRVTAIQREFETRKQAEFKAILDQTTDQNNTDLAKEKDELKSAIQLHKNEFLSAAKKLEDLKKTNDDLQVKLKETEDRNKELTKDNATQQTKNQKLNKKNDETKKKLEDLQKDINRIREQRNKYDDEVRAKNEEIRRLQEIANKRGPNKRPRTDYNQQNYDRPSNDRQNYDRPNYDKPNSQPAKWNQANTKNQSYDQPKGHQPNNWSKNQSSSADLTQRELDIKDRELSVRDKEIEILKATLNQRSTPPSSEQELKLKEKEIELMRREKALTNQGMDHWNFQPTNPYAF